MIRATALSLSLLAATSAAIAADEPPAYLDNRSDAASLVKSLYNAINRKEYARAWSYYGDEKPAKSLQAFEDGYKDTSSINVKIGKVTAEGAAGSTYFSIPVAIQAFAEGKPAQVFAGCYTARLANPGVQADAFQPMQLQKGSLKPSNEGLQSAPPDSCGAGEPIGGDAILEQAKAAYIATNAPTCDRADPASGLPESIEDYTIKYRHTGDPDTQPESTVRLFSFACFAGAYNFSAIYYLYDDLGGMRQIEFPVPKLDIVYENPDDTENSKVKSITVTGFYGDGQLLNSEFDPATNTISAFEKWRGIGDASSVGTWVFKDGNFVLVKYDVDASYDGESEGQTVVDYESAP